MAINWQMGGPQNNALQYFQLGNQLGAQMRDRQEKRETRNALATVLRKPSQTPGIGDRQRQGVGEDEAWGTLYANNPELAYRVESRQQDRQQKLTEQQQKLQGEADKYIAQSAFAIVQMPPEQQAAAWDAYIDNAKDTFPALQQFKGQYSPERLASIVAKAGQMKEFQSFQQPRYEAVGEGGLSGFQYGKPIMQGAQPQNFGQPGVTAPAAPRGAPPAGQAYSTEQYRGLVDGLGSAEEAAAYIKRNRVTIAVTSPEEARQLPSGTPIVLPDGSPGVVP